MSAGYDEKTIVWDVSFSSFNNFLLFCLLFSSIFLVTKYFVYGVSRYEKARPSGRMKLDALSWLMESFPCKLFW